MKIIVLYANHKTSIVSKGQGANMLKIGTKRRRTKAQIKDEKRVQLLKEQEQASAMLELAMLRE